MVGLQEPDQGNVRPLSRWRARCAGADLYKGTVVLITTPTRGKEMNSLDFMSHHADGTRRSAYLARSGTRSADRLCLGGAGPSSAPPRSRNWHRWVFYGIPPEQAAKPADVKIPLQGHFAPRTIGAHALVDGFEKGMKAAGKSLELFRYDADTVFQRAASIGARPPTPPSSPGRATEFFQEAPGV